MDLQICLRLIKVQQMIHLEFMQFTYETLGMFCLLGNVRELSFFESAVISRKGDCLPWGKLPFAFRLQIFLMKCYKSFDSE